MVSTLRMLTSLMFHCHALLRCVVNRIGELGLAIVCSVTWHDDALSVVNSIVTWNRMENPWTFWRMLIREALWSTALQWWNSPHTRRFWISRASRFFARIPPWKARKTVVLPPAIPPARRSFRWITFNVYKVKKGCKKVIACGGWRNTWQKALPISRINGKVGQFHQASILWLAQTLTSARGAISRMLDLIPAGDVILCSMLSEVFCSKGPCKWLVTVT